MLAAFVRHPTQLEAAMEADRQLKLADLFSTALSVRQSADSWAQVIRTLAEERCRATSPSTVLLHRWGGRAWGGMGLAVALVVTFGLVFSQSPAIRAGISPARVFVQQDNLGVPERGSTGTYSRGGQPSVRRNTMDDTDPSAENDGQNTNTATQTDKNTTSDPASANAKRPSAADPNRSGGGAAGTSDAHSAMPPSIDGSNAAKRDGQGLTATGGQSDSASAAPNPTANSASGASGQGKRSTSVPPWTSASWGEDRQRALEQINSRPEYDAYRDLIRGYFERR